MSKEFREYWRMKADERGEIMPHSLGKNQIGFIMALLKHGEYKPRTYGGWQWTTPSATMRIVSSLERRGLVYKNLQGGYQLTRRGVADAIQKDRWRMTHDEISALFNRHGHSYFGA